ECVIGRAETEGVAQLVPSHSLCRGVHTAREVRDGLFEEISRVRRQRRGGGKQRQYAAEQQDSRPAVDSPHTNVAARSHVRLSNHFQSTHRPLWQLSSPFVI